MDVNKYLRRINVEKPIHVDLQSLAHLQNKHMLSVPFENLDVMEGVDIPLDVETYYEKIVNEKRGGFCYELNELFHWLLKESGFSTYLISATIHRSDGTWGREGSHAAQIVTLDQPYLLDVGFGNSARLPLPLTGESRKDVSGEYRILSVEDGFFHKQRKEEGRWRTLYRFSQSEKELTDFKDVCHIVQTSPESHFTQRLLVTIARENGRLTLARNKLTITENGNKREKEIDEKDIPSLLEKEFGIYTV